MGILAVTNNGFFNSIFTPVSRFVPGWAQFILAAAAILVAVSTIWKLAVKPMFHGVRDTAKAVQRIASLMEAEPILTDIVAAFRPNGGSSLPQTVKRIEDKVDKIHDEHIDFRKEHEEFRQKLLRQEVEIHDLWVDAEDLEDAKATNGQKPSARRTRKEHH